MGGGFGICSRSSRKTGRGRLFREDGCGLEISSRPYGTGLIGAMPTQGSVRAADSTLHPTDIDRSAGTPVLGYSRVLPTGDLRVRGHDPQGTGIGE